MHNSFSTAASSSSNSFVHNLLRVFFYWLFWLHLVIFPLWTKCILKTCLDILCNANVVQCVYRVYSHTSRCLAGRIFTVFLRKSQRLIIVLTIYPEGDLNVCTNIHDHLSNGCWAISVWTKSVSVMSALEEMSLGLILWGPRLPSAQLAWLKNDTHTQLKQTLFTNNLLLDNVIQFFLHFTRITEEHITEEPLCFFFLPAEMVCEHRTVELVNIQ